MNQRLPERPKIRLFKRPPALNDAAESDRNPTTVPDGGGYSVMRRLKNIKGKVILKDNDPHFIEHLQHYRATGSWILPE